MFERQASQKVNQDRRRIDGIRAESGRGVTVEKVVESFPQAVENPLLRLLSALPNPDST